MSPCCKCSTALRAVICRAKICRAKICRAKICRAVILGTEFRAALGACRAFSVFVFWFAIAVATLFAFPGDVHAQPELGVPVREALRLRVQDVLIQDVDVLGLQPGIAFQPANSKPQLLRQMRGLIQNELSIVSELCDLDQKQQQTLVDLAESEWKAKTNTSIGKRVQEQVYGTIDLDGLAERVVRFWVVAVANTDQIDKYDRELADRMTWRRNAVVSKLLDLLEVKLNLSGIQMAQIEEVLNEKWKDRFYHSLEATFDNASLLPDIRTSWLTPLLSESQRAALVTQNPQTAFGTVPMLQNSPSLAVESRFMVGNTTSSVSIEIEPVSKKAIEKDGSKVIEGILKKAKEEEEGGVVDAKKP